jgi:hypothetical protein
MLAPQAGKPGLLVTTTAFGNYEFSVEYRQARNGALALLANCDAEGKLPDGQKPGSYPARGGWWRLWLRVEGGKVVGQKLTSRNEGFGRKDPIERYAPQRLGYIGLSGNGFIVRNVKLRPVNTKSLFNGKDLSGWKKYEGDKKRAKSTFSVTKEGWLHLANGPGDLQTQGRWADFVLQLDCRTNGKGLNSGVFFRCLPGQYQMGYEAQVHNGFSEPPGKEYTLEEYDPKTHALKGKRKERFTALDYGTGAVYRRQPTRFQVAKDREWFTMTVVARGRHVATWVNGVQVVDWTDNRPEAANARAGCYLKKGPLSLQGHDPTTDLDFRNFRLAELPPPK